MLKEKEKKAMLYYEKQVQTPRMKFILIHGLTWGVLLLVCISTIEYFFQEKTLAMQWEEGLLIRIIIMPFAGLFYGWINRRMLEKRYNDLKKRDGFMN